MNRSNQINILLNSFCNNCNSTTVCRADEHNHCLFYKLLDKIIYVIQSNEFIEDSKPIFRVIKAFYKLKQSSRMWYEVIKSFLKSLNFELINSENSVFVSKNKKIYIAVYINNFLIVDENMNYINEINSKLSDRIKIHDLKSVQHYLSIEIVRDNNNILFN